MDLNQYDSGLQLRRRVIGEDYVDRALAGATDFTRPLQDRITEYTWGTVWSRPGLDLRIRSLVTVAMLAALNRPTELELHLRGALRNGATWEEIRETLLHVAVYAGTPAAVDAFRIGQEIMNDSPGSAPF
jgi:4-carboxymuconolactone decarboxylase